MHQKTPEQIADEILQNAAVGKGKAGGRGPKQADILIGLAQSAELFHSPDGTGFADLDINGHRETWPIRSKGATSQRGATPRPAHVSPFGPRYLGGTFLPRRALPRPGGRPRLGATAPPSRCAICASSCARRLPSSRST
jgi:hypothetical protein